MCDRCADLEERVAWLESELGLQREADDVARLRNAIMAPLWPGGTTGGRQQAAKMVAALYAAKGRTMTTAQLLEAIPPAAGGDDERDTKIVSVWVCVARRALGFNAIATTWGKGYRLTEDGMGRVADILNPTARAA